MEKVLTILLSSFRYSFRILMAVRCKQDAEQAGVGQHFGGHFLGAAN